MNSYDPDGLCTSGSLLCEWVVIFPNQNNITVDSPSLNISSLYSQSPVAFGTLPSSLSIQLILSCSYPIHRCSSASVSLVVFPPSSVLRDVSIVLSSTSRLGDTGFLVSSDNELALSSVYILDNQLANINSVNYMWSISDTSLDLSNSLVVPSTLTSASLVLASGTLLANHTYTLFLNCTVAYTLSSSTSVLSESMTTSLTVITDDMVQGGVCTLSASEGLAFQTRCDLLFCILIRVYDVFSLQFCSFKVDCEGFTTSHRPISFSFGTRVTSTTSSLSVSWIVTSTLASSVIIPPFVKNDSYDIVIVAQDSYGYSTRLHSVPPTVLVRLPTVVPSACSVFNQTSQQLSHALAINDVQRALYLISSLAEVLLSQCSGSSSFVCETPSSTLDGYRLDFVAYLVNIYESDPSLPCTTAIDILSDILSCPGISEELADYIHALLDELLSSSNCFSSSPTSVTAAGWLVDLICLLVAPLPA